MENLNHIAESLNLKLYIFQGNYRGEEYREIYETTYLCWREVWGHVYEAEMGQHHHFYSDDFQRQDEIITLFAANRCVGMAFLRHVNLSQLAVRDDSCFRYWTPESLDLILSKTSKIAVASYFTIQGDFRKMKLGLCWKTLMLSLFIENFHYTNSDIMITAARKMKSNEKLCYKLGAEMVVKDVPYWIDDQKQVNSESVDIIYWDKRPLVLDDQLINSLKEKIWNNKISLIEMNQQIKEVKNAA